MQSRNALCVLVKIKRIKNLPTKSVDLYNMMSNDVIGKDLCDEINFHYVDLDNAYTCSNFNNKNNFNVIHLNVHSIRAKHSHHIEMLNNLTGKGSQCACFTLV